MKLSDIVPEGWEVSIQFNSGAGFQTGDGKQTLGELIIEAMMFGFDMSRLYEDGKLMYERLAELVAGISIDDTKVNVSLAF